MSMTNVQTPADAARAASAAAVANLDKDRRIGSLVRQLGEQAARAAEVISGLEALADMRQIENAQLRQAVIDQSARADALQEQLTASLREPAGSAADGNERLPEQPPGQG